MYVQPKSLREEIIETVNKLFNYTDSQNWKGLLNDIFTEKVWFDMSSLGGGKPSELTASAICSAWEQGFRGIDHVHHQAGNFVVTINPESAEVFCYAIALHYKKSALKGNIREYVGSYDMRVVRAAEGWRINSFRYNVKFINGNIELQ